MVKVEIVEEKDTSASPYASSSSSRNSSSESLSSVESDTVDESFFDRVVALKDIVPPTTRHSISTTFVQTASFVKRGSKIIGNIVWVVTTSALLVALPLSLVIEDENKVMAQEKEMLEQQQGAQQVRSVLSFLSPLILYSLDACSICISCPTRFRSPGSTKSSNSSRFLSWARSSVYYIISFLFLMTAIGKIHHFSIWHIHAWLITLCVSAIALQTAAAFLSAAQFFRTSGTLPNQWILNILYWEKEIKSLSTSSSTLQSAEIISTSERVINCICGLTMTGVGRGGSTVGRT